MPLSRFPVLRDILIEQRRALRYAVERPRIERLLRQWKKAREEKGTRENLFPHLGIAFVHIPKTAGTSIQQFLTELEDPVGTRHFQMPNRPYLHKHAKTLDWRAELGPEKWQKYYSFCRVRNSYELMVSSYFWWLQRAKQFPTLLKDALIIEEMGSFEKFMRSRYGRHFINEAPGSISDCYTVNRHDAVKFIGRVENLEEDIAHVLVSVDIPIATRNIPTINRTKRRD